MQTRKQKYITSVILFAILLALYFFSSHWVSDSSNDLYQLTGEWTVEEESDSQTVPSLADYHFAWKDGERIVLRTIMPELQVEHPMLRMWFYHTAFTVRLDGKVVYESGIKELKTGKMTPNGIFLIPIAEDFQGKELEISLENQISNGFTTLPNVALQQEYIVLDSYYKSNVLQIGTASFLFIVTILFIMLMIIYRKDSFVSRKLLFISAISLITSFWLFMNSGMLRNLNVSLGNFAELEYILLFATPLIVILYVMDRQSNPLYKKICAGLAFVNVVFIVLSVQFTMTHALSLGKMLIAFHIFGAIALSLLLWFTLYNCFVKKEKTDIAFLEGIAIMIMLLLVDIIRFNYKKYFTNATSDLNDIIIPLSILVLIFSMILSSMLGILKNIEMSIETKVEERISNTDKLTGLASRAKCVDYLNERVGSDLLIVFDIKGLGRINEKFGPSHGDNYLTSFAYSLKNVFDEAHLIGRIRDDEFVVVTKQMTNDELSKAINLLREVAAVAVMDDENPLEFYFASESSKDQNLWKYYELLQKKIVEKKR